MSCNARRFHIGTTVRELLQQRRKNRRLNARQSAAAAWYVPRTAVRSEDLEDRTLLAGIHDNPDHPAWQLNLSQVATQDVLHALDAIADIGATQAEQAVLNDALS